MSNYESGRPWKFSIQLNWFIWPLIQIWSIHFRNSWLSFLISGRPFLTVHFWPPGWPLKIDLVTLIYETLHNNFSRKHFYLQFLILCIDTVSTILNSIFTRLIKTYLRIRYQFLSLIINKQAKNFRIFEIFKIPKPAHKIPAGEKMDGDLFNQDPRSSDFESKRSVNKNIRSRTFDPWPKVYHRSFVRLAISTKDRILHVNGQIIPAKIVNFRIT